MSKPSSTTWVLTGINVASALTAVLCTGYVAGLLEAKAPQPGDHPAAERAEVSQTATEATTRRVTPNPHVGHGQHPTFDCTTMSEAVGDRPEGAVSIEDLGAKSSEYKGEPVVVKGRVIQAFPQIMGVNWLHVCDQPSGRVLVASSTQWANPGSEVVLRGILSINRTIAGAYTFPLFIEKAKLEGQTVECDRPKPNGTLYDL